jgi:hypothetical protein
VLPRDPKKKWWFEKGDTVSECVEKCQYNLLQTALQEAGMQSASEPLSNDQRIIHARFAALQPQCMDACMDMQI